ncbi:hypothetical protein D3C72_2047960 [compost metagenome]
MSRPLLLLPLKPAMTAPCVGQPQSLRREAGGTTGSRSRGAGAGLAFSALPLLLLRDGGVAAPVAAPPGGTTRSTWPASSWSGSLIWFQRAISAVVRPCR